MKVAPPKLCLHPVYHATAISISESATQEYPGIAAGVLLSNTCNSQTMSWLDLGTQTYLDFHRLTGSGHAKREGQKEVSNCGNYHIPMI